MAGYGRAAAVTAVLGLGLVAGAADATELWDPHLRGVESGLAAGALPPEGVYFVLDNYWATYDQHSSNKSNGTKLDALVEVPILLWNPGIKLLGADYAVAVAQPFDYTNVTYNGNAVGSHWGTYNTYFAPAILSWALPYDFHVKGSFGVYLDTASSSPGHAPSGGGVGAGNGFTTFETGLGVSWLHDGWNASVQLYYETSTKNDRTDYQSGDQIAVDYTFTKTINKWTVGVGGYQINQIERDSVAGQEKVGTVAFSYGLGPIVGYDFGGLNLQAHYTHALLVHNDVGGDFFNVRAVVPLY